MPIILLVLGYFFPRLIIVLLYIFTAWWKTAFDSVLWPVLGFLFLPLTTLWYGISEVFFGEQLQTIGLIIAVLADLGIIGRSARKRR